MVDEVNMSHDDDFKDGNKLGNEETLTFSLIKEKDNYILDIMSSVYDALSERGYNPTNQIVGYLMSGDPTYITANRGARTLILKFSREEILETFVRRSLR